MIIYIGADHRGYNLKEIIKSFLKNIGYNVVDCGNSKYDSEDDYVDFGSIAAKNVSKDYENAKGILICASGAGMSIVANRFNRVRAGVAVSPNQAFDGKRDDDTNVLIVPANYVTQDLAKKIIVTWLETQFSTDPKYKRRLDKITELEERKEN